MDENLDPRSDLSLPPRPRIDVARVTTERTELLKLGQNQRDVYGYAPDGYAVYSEQAETLEDIGDTTLCVTANDVVMTALKHIQDDIVNRDLRIEPGEGSDAAFVATLCEWLLSAQGQYGMDGEGFSLSTTTDRLCRFLCRAIISGIEVVEQIWGEIDGVKLPLGHYPKDIRSFELRQESGYYRLYYKTREVGQLLGVKSPYRRFLPFMYSSVPSHNPLSFGLHSILAPMVKNYSKLLDASNELIYHAAAPTAVIKYPAGASAEEFGKVHAAVAKRGTRSTISLPDDYSIEYVEVPTDRQEGLIQYRLEKLTDRINLLVKGEATAGEEQSSWGQNAQQSENSKLRYSTSKALSEEICAWIQRNLFASVIKANGLDSSPPKLYRVFGDLEQEQTDQQVQGQDII